MNQTTDFSGTIGSAELLAVALDIAAIAHDSGDLASLEKIRSVVGSFEALGEGKGGRELTFGLNFLDGWVRAANHDWSHHEGISEAEWPRLGRLIALSLRRSNRALSPSPRFSLDSLHGSSPGAAESR